MYAILKWTDGKQYKVATNVKVCPWEWDSKRQQPTATAENATDIFTLINKLNLCFANLNCIFAQEGVTPTASEVLSTLKEVLNKDVMNNENLIKGRNPKATTLLTKGFEKYCERRISEANKKNYKSAVTRFANWLVSTNQDRQGMLSTKGLDQFRNHLREKGSSPSAINKACKAIKLVINEYCTQFARTPIQEVKFVQEDEVKKNQNDRKRQPLTQDEVIAFASVHCENEKEEEARDIFTMLCEVGCRPEDVHIIFNKEYEEVNGFAVYNTRKKNVTAHTPLTESVRELQEKYRQGFKYWNIEYLADTINSYIRKLAKRANIDRSVTYTDQKGNVLTRPLYEIISMYCARHTFTTLKIKEGVSVSDLKFMTGHTTTTCIETNYGHFTAQMVTSNLLRSMHQQSEQEQPQEFANVEEIIRIGRKQAEQDRIREYKEVLSWMGRPYAEYAETHTSEDLFRLIAKYESKLLEKGYDVEKLKNLFNNYAKEDYKAFRRVMADV